MSKTKYGKYFITYDKEKSRFPNVIAHMEDNVAKGSNFYVVMWMFPTGSTLEKEAISWMRA